jgi:hypothetical protein
VRLLPGDPAAQSPVGGIAGIGARGIDYVLGSFGVRRFLESVDAGTVFRDADAGDTILSALLNWVAREGFGETMERHGLDYDSPRAYRERHFDQTIAALLKSGVLHRH